MKKARAFSVIHRRRGWGIFLFGIGIALILGLSIRSLFSPKILENWVLQKIEEEGLSGRLRVEGVRLDLASSAFPRVAFRIDKLILKGKGPCPSSIFTLHELYLPIGLSSSARGQIAFNTIDIAAGEIAVRPACQENLSVARGDPPTNPRVVKSGAINSQERWKREIDTGLKQLFGYFQRRWPNDWERGVRKVQGLDIEKLAIFDGSSHKRWAMISKMRVELGERESLTLDAQVKVEDYLLKGGGTIRPFSVAIQVDAAQGEVELKGLFQEGQVDASWRADWRDKSHSFSLKAKDFPLRGLPTFYQEWLEKELPLNLRRVWLTCQFDHKSKLGSLFSSDLKMSDCNLYGNGGKLEVQSFRVQFAEKVKISPFSILFDGVSLEHFVSVIGSRGPMGVFNSLGRVYGTLNFESVDQMSGDFDLKGLELAFSNNGVHGLQLISQLRLNLERVKGRVSALINRIDIEEGGFSGALSFNLDPTLTEGDLEVKVEELSFNPAVQRLLVGGELSPLALHGKAKIIKGEVEQWRGTLETQSVRSEYWELDEFKMDMKWMSKTMYGDVRVKSIQLKEGSRVRPITESLLLSKSLKEGNSAWRGLRAELEMDSARGSWKKFKAVNAVDSEIRLFSYGSWFRDGELDGVISVESPTLPKLDWSIVGGWKSLRVFPTAHSVGKLLSLSEKSQQSKKVLSESWFEDLVEEGRVHRRKTGGKTGRKTSRKAGAGQEGY
ncbi:hypothetical protein OAQ84_00640 [Bdellovibrionales bacterium]|nr:hypothetical protein [Bdellovibrionales bacterium]